MNCFRISKNFRSKNSSVLFVGDASFVQCMWRFLAFKLQFVRTTYNILWTFLSIHKNVKKAVGYFFILLSLQQENHVPFSVELLSPTLLTRLPLSGSSVNQESMFFSHLNCTPFWQTEAITICNNLCSWHQQSRHHPYHCAGVSFITELTATVSPLTA